MKMKKKSNKVQRVIHSTYTVNYSTGNITDNIAVIEVTEPIPVNHCPTCGQKLKKK